MDQESMRPAGQPAAGRLRVAPWAHAAVWLAAAAIIAGAMAAGGIAAVIASGGSGGQAHASVDISNPPITPPGPKLVLASVDVTNQQPPPPGPK